MQNLELYVMVGNILLSVLKAALRPVQVQIDLTCLLLISGAHLPLA